jgi:hypothetical protein
MRFDFAKHKRAGDRPWYLQLVKENIKQVSATDRHGNPRHSYYTYGQDHDRRNPDWKPFRLLACGKVLDRIG